MAKKMGVWVICGEELLGILRRVANGEDPDMVYAELYANAEIEDVEEDGTE